MIYLVAIFVGAGCAMAGWILGAAIFTAVFEVLRLLHAEASLDSTAALSAFRYAHAAAAIVAGLWLLWRWRPRADQTAPAWRVVGIATIAAIGCMLVAAPAIIPMVRSAQTLIPLLVSLVAALIGGATITAIAYGRSVSRMMTGWRGALAAIAALATVWLGFIFDSEMSRFHARLGQPRTVLIDIRIPHDWIDRPAWAAIRITMRSEGRDFPGQPEFWLPEGDGGMLRASVPLVIGTRDRTVVLTIPNEPERLLRIDLPTSPRPTSDFGPWVRLEAAVESSQAPVAAREARYLIR
jgi:hypothetical protein